MSNTNDVDQQICLQIIAVWKQIKQNIETFAAEHNLTLQQIMLLYQLSQVDYMLMGDLAKHMHCDASNITGLVERMQFSGLVRREESAEDRRAKQISITPAGQTFIESLIPRLPDGVGLECLSSHDTAELSRLLQKLQPSG